MRRGEHGRGRSLWAEVDNMVTIRSGIAPGCSRSATADMGGGREDGRLERGVEAWPRPGEHHSGPLGRFTLSSRTMFMNSSPCSMASSTATWVCRATACQCLGMRAFTALR